MSRVKPENQRTGHARTSKVPARASTAGKNPKKYRPAPPECLSDKAALVWLALWALPLPWTAADEYAVQRYVQLRERRDKLQAILDAEGYMAVGSMGQTTAHPALKAIGDVESSLKSLEVQLLLTPDGRARYGIGTDEDNPLNDWLADASAAFEQGGNTPA